MFHYIVAKLKRFNLYSTFKVKLKQCFESPNILHHLIDSNLYLILLFLQEHYPLFQNSLAAFSTYFLQKEFGKLAPLLLQPVEILVLQIRIESWKLLLHRMKVGLSLYQTRIGLLMLPTNFVLLKMPQMKVVELLLMVLQRKVVMLLLHHKTL